MRSRPLLSRFAPTPEVRFALAGLALCVALQSALRAVFLLVHRAHFASAPGGEVARAFALGVRFDLSISAAAFLPLMLLGHLPLVGRFGAWRKLWVGLASAVPAAYVAVLFADLVCYPHLGRRVGGDVFVYLNRDLLPILLTGLQEAPAAFLAGLVSVGLAAAAVILAARRIGVLRNRPLASRWSLLTLSLVTAALVLAWRGSLGRGPLRAGDALVSRHEAVNQLALSGPFLTLHSLARLTPPRLMDAPRARAVALEMLGRPPGAADAEHPVLVVRPGASPSRLNLVLVVMEGWSASLVGALGGDLGLTPEFDALAGGGLLFERFFANGVRTRNGVFCTLTGLPDVNPLPVMRRPQIGNSFGSLSRLLAEQGYRNLFFTGGSAEFDNLRNLLIQQRFDVVVGQEDLRGCGGPERAWGFDDEHLFRRAADELGRAQEPFFAAVLTESSHAPYEIPDGFPRLFQPGQHPQHLALNAYRYSDWSLGEFFRRARSEPWFERTVFAILADHTHHDGLDPHENQRIPLLLIGPGLEAGRRRAVGSQVDLIPTIAGLLGLPWHASMGRDLLAPEQGDGFAYFIDGGTQLGLIEGGYLARLAMDTRQMVLFDLSAGDFSTDLSAARPEVAARMRERLLAYYQTGVDLVFADRVAPRQPPAPAVADR